MSCYRCYRLLPPNARVRARTDLPYYYFNTDARTGDTAVAGGSSGSSGSGNAIAYLLSELADGPRLARDLLEGCGPDFSERTLRQAKVRLGIRSTKDKQGWWWTR